MTSHSPRTMMEMSKTVVFCTCLFFWKTIWCKSLGKDDLKSGKSSVLQAWNCSFVRRGFRRKVPFLVSNTKLAEIVQLLLPDPLGKRGAIKSDLRIEVPVCLPGSPSNWVWRSFQQSVLDSSGPKESAGSIYSSCAKVEGCSGRMCGSAREHPAT